MSLNVFQKINIITIITVLAWLAFEAYRANSAVPGKLENIVVEEIDPTLDLHTLEDLKGRIQLAPEETPTFNW